MTFAEALAAVREIARANGDSVCLRVEAWTFDHDAADQIVIRVWSSTKSKHFDAATLAAVVGVYHAAWLPQNQPGADISEIETIGEVTP